MSREKGTVDRSYFACSWGNLYRIEEEGLMSKLIENVASPDAPTTVNEKGAGQSHIEVRFDLIDGPALFEMAHVLYKGAAKYGENNWRGIPVEEHLNHMIMHAYAYLSGDTSDHHLSHILCRATFAQAVAIQNNKEVNND